MAHLSYFVCSLLLMILAQSSLGESIQTRSGNREFKKEIKVPQEVQRLKLVYRRSINETKLDINKSGSKLNPTSGNTKTIFIGLLLPFTFARLRSEFKGGAKYYAAAFPLALKSVNENPRLLPGYKLIYTWSDTRCTEKYNIRAMYDQYQTRDKQGLPIHGFIGLGCECDSAAKFASAMEVPLVSHVSMIMIFSTYFCAIAQSPQPFEEVKRGNLPLGNLVHH